MRFSYSLLLDVAWAAVVGVVTAVSVIPINVAAMLIWLWLLIVRYRRLRKFSVIVVQCGALTFLLVAAALAPVKITQPLLAMTVSLDAKQMSLQRLDTYIGSPDHRQQFPIRTYLTFAEEDENTIVKWPSTQMTLGEFISAIESQTRLRHRFNGCGNGWTLLWGNNCCFGLSIRDPELVGPPPYPRKRYQSQY